MNALSKSSRLREDTARDWHGTFHTILGILSDRARI